MNGVAFNLKISYDRKRVFRMLSDNLSACVPKLCDTQKLNYEISSERCNFLSEYFGEIAGEKAAMTILTLEKLCVGFDLTHNEMLILSSVLQEMAFREPMPVTHIRCFSCTYGVTGFPLCPQCGITMEREYQSYCNRCGQQLDWKDFSDATVIFSKK